MPMLSSKGGTMSQELTSRWWLNDAFGFHGIPPADAQIALQRAIMVCAKGDGELSQKELDWITGFGAACNLSVENLEELRSYPADEDIASVVGSHPMVEQLGKRTVLYFAIRAAKSDGDLAEGEVTTIKRLAEQIGESATTVDDIVALTDAEDALRTKRISLLELEKLPFG